MTTFEQIAKLLPENLSESGLEEIASIIEETVQERVDAETKSLEAKVGGFMRMKLNEMKEQAVRELERTTKPSALLKYTSLLNQLSLKISQLLIKKA